MALLLLVKEGSLGHPVKLRAAKLGHFFWFMFNEYALQ